MQIIGGEITILFVFLLRASPASHPLFLLSPCPHFLLLPSQHNNKGIMNVKNILYINNPPLYISS